MAQIKKILFPVDFSDSCAGAARYVAAFAGQFEAEIMLLHAVSNGENTLANELLPGCQARLNGFLADELKYFTTHRECVVKDPAEAIADCARTWNPDLAMLPTHGLGYFRRHLFGSVTAKALHDLKCPVWTSVHAETAPALEAIHCRRILCAVDLSAHSRNILNWAAGLAGEYRAQLGIAHAMTPVGAAAAEYLEPAYLEKEFHRYVSEKAQKEIDRLQSAAQTSAQVFLEAGNPVEVIAAAAKDFDADLLVIGRHGASGTPGHHTVNAFAIMRESPCPVISI